MDIERKIQRSFRREEIVIKRELEFQRFMEVREAYRERNYWLSTANQESDRFLKANPEIRLLYGQQSGLFPQE